MRSPTKATSSPLQNTNSGIMDAAAAQQQQHHVLEDMAKENYWLREKLKEMTSDRDRLLCEVANLRLELDMMELKRLPDDNK